VHIYEMRSDIIGGLCQRAQVSVHHQSSASEGFGKGRFKRIPLFSQANTVNVEKNLLFRL